MMTVKRILSFASGTAAAALSSPAVQVSISKTQSDDGDDPLTLEIEAAQGSVPTTPPSQSRQGDAAQGDTFQLESTCNGEPAVALAIVKLDSEEGVVEQGDVEQGGDAKNDDDFEIVDDDIDTPIFANGEAVDPEAGAVILCMEDQDGKKIYMVPTKAKQSSILDYIPTGRRAVALTFTAEAVRFLSIRKFSFEMMSLSFELTRTSVIDQISFSIFKSNRR
jgi:hypothetical protein